MRRQRKYAGGREGCEASDRGNSPAGKLSEYVSCGVTDGAYMKYIEIFAKQSKII